jgi:hypothetical protein
LHRVLNDENRDPSFFYLLLAITIVAWTSVDDSMSMQLHFEYQKF